MTLVAAFRCQNGGILLCADREESDGWTKREVDKICRISHPKLTWGEIFIAGAGPSAAITDVCAQIEQCVWQAKVAATDVMMEHVAVIERGLKLTHERYAGKLEYPLNLIVVVAPFREGVLPLLYKTESDLLIPENEYVAWGSGKPIADYLASHLFKWDRLDKVTLAALAAFILREAEHCAPGVGLGADMVFIHEHGSTARHHIHKDSVKEIQDGIPDLVDTIYSHWKEHAKVPDWVNVDVRK